MRPKTVEEIRALIAFSDPFETYRAWKELIIPAAMLADAERRAPARVREVEALEVRALDCGNPDEQRALLLTAAKQLLDVLAPKH